MTLIASNPGVVATDGRLAAAARACASPWLAAAMVAAAVASQSFGHHNGDNSWLFTVAEKVIDGARPYVDVIESNPPAAFLFYAPAVYAARLAHVSVELAASALVFLCCAANILFTGRIAARSGLMPRHARAVMANALVFAFVLLPGFSFAEREHVACLFLAPLLAVTAARASGLRVGVGDALIAGLAAAFAMAMKPHFALAALVPLLFVVARQRSPRPLFETEQWAIVAGVAINVVIVLWLFPGYLAIAPASFDAYVPLREPLSWLVSEPWFLTNVALLAGLAIAFGRDCRAPTIAVPALGSLGFIATFFLQGKGWVNHGLPGAELAFVAVGAAMAPLLAVKEEAALEAGWARLRRPTLFLFLPALLGAPVLFGLLLPATSFEEYKGLTAAVLRHAPPHPRVIALSPRLDVGHPLTRRVGGEWVGRPNALWLMIFSQMFLDAGRGDAAYRARLADYVARDARGFREDVEKGRPDVVLVVEDARVEKAMKNPDIAAAMANYAPTETADGVEVWTRRP